MTQGHHRHPVMSWAQNWPNIAISFDIFPQDQGLAPALAECGKQLSVTVRESRAGAKDRGRRLTSTFLPKKQPETRTEKIINGGIFGSWWVFYFKINIFLKSGPYTGLNKFDFRPTFVESTWKKEKCEKIAIRFFASRTNSILIEV